MSSEQRCARESQPLVRDVLLRDGSTLRLQAPIPADFGEIKAFYDGLSPESRYFRFHGYGRTDIVAHAEAEATGVDRLALIGRHEGRVVSVASWDGLREKGVAEVAFAVANKFQRRGIGMRMLEQLAVIAADRGIHRFPTANPAPQPHPARQDLVTWRSRSPVSSARLTNGAQNEGPVDS
ncbi:MAG: N-acetyltransferase family protein [Solirubrobacteraceae bacterium]